MASLSFTASSGQVYMVDGPWEVRLTEAQCDQLLDIFDEANAVRSFNDLYAACSLAGHVEKVVSRKALRLVVSR